MCSGKSTALIAYVTRSADIGLPSFYITHTSDVRLSEASDGTVTTHNSGFRGMSPKVHCIKVASLSTVDVSEFKVIGVDEFQFFTNGVEVIRHWIEDLHKIVIVASLDGDFMRGIIGEYPKLIPLIGASNVKGFKAVCKKCDPLEMRDAIYTVKLSTDNSIIDPGGVDKYCPVCPECYRKFNIH